MRLFGGQPKETDQRTRRLRVERELEAERNKSAQLETEVDRLKERLAALEEENKHCGQVIARMRTNAAVDLARAGLEAKRYGIGPGPEEKRDSDKQQPT